MSPNALSFLTDEDRAALLERATLRHADDHEVLVAQADANRALYWVRDGYVLVQRDVGGVRLSVARIAHGEFFGEMSLLEHAPTSATVVADGPVELAVIAAHDLNELCDELPGFETRFYRSLAVLLSQRLRALGGFVGAMERHSAEQHQHLVDRLQPPDPAEHDELLSAATDLRRRLADSEFSATLGGDETEAFEAVFEEVGAMLARRGAPAAAVVHRELYTTWMCSRTMAGSLLSAGGSPCANPTFERILANEPSGESFVGPVLDAWLLRRSALVGLRWAASQVAEQLTGGAITLLGAIHGPATRAAIQHADRLAVLDADEGSLLDLHARAAGRRVLLAQMSPVELARGRGQLTLMPAEHVVGIGLLDRTPDADVPELLALCRRLVSEGGTVWLSSTDDDPDLPLFRHLLGWECVRRSRPEVEAMARAAGLEVEVHVHPSQHLFAMRRNAS